MSDPLSETLFSQDGDEEVPSNIYADNEEPPPSLYKEDKYPAPTKLRESGESLLTSLVFGVGAVLVHRRIDPPVGRCFQLEAPLAGKRIDDAIAGTFLDRILQPIFRKADDLEGLGAVLALPIMVGIYERKPETAVILEPIMYEALGTIVDQVVPLMKKERTKQRRVARSLNDISDAFNIPKDVKDPIGAIFGGFIFQDMAQEEGGYNAEEE